MKQSLVMMVLLLITVLGLGKVAAPLLMDDQEHIKAMGHEVMLVAKQDIAATDPSPKEKDDVIHNVATPIEEVKVASFYESWSGEWISNELIPSVEAAEAMPLMEERGVRGGETVKVAKLREMKRKLDSREKSLDERESEAKKAELRAKDKIFELEQLETRIRDLLAQEKSIKDKKIKRLTAVYEGMKAVKAAPVIGQMDLGIVVKIFSRMSEKQVGKILSFLPPKKAVVISQALTQRIGTM